MHRQDFLKDLELYRDSWGAGRVPYPGLRRDEEAAQFPLFQEFVSAHADCFERTCIRGHITGSALVVKPNLTEVLLTLHGKLNIWLQLGGHADGEPHPHNAAMREAREESGLTNLTFFDASKPRPLPFDLDRHLIPARKNDPDHYHYDVRYLIVAHPGEALAISDESHDLRWFTLAEARKVTQERSMLRQFDKLAWLALTRGP